MFTRRVSGSQSIYSPFAGAKVSKSTAAGRRSVGMFSTGKRTPFVARSPALNKSALQTSLIVEESAQHVVESFGTSLPVLITEALMLADRTTETSVKIDPSGWAWLVCGRRLFVWKYKQSQIVRATVCKELPLPPSDLSHKADLVSVVAASDGGPTVSVMAVTPDGIIRYWPSLTNEGAFVETSADLNGEECFSLTAVQLQHPCEYVLATTTNQLLLLSPSSSGMQNTVSWHQLSPNKGMFSRMSSFIFGSQRTQSSQLAAHCVLAGLEEDDADDDNKYFYALTGSVVQKWQLCHGTSEKILYECQVEKMMRDHFIQELDVDGIEDPGQIKVWMLDMQLVRNGIAILGAAYDTKTAIPTMYYAVGVFDTSGSDTPLYAMSFTLLKYSIKYEASIEDKLLNHCLLLSDPRSKTAYMYSENYIISFSVSSKSASYDRIDFQSPGDCLLGSGSYTKQPIFFSNNHGLVSLRSQEQRVSSFDLSATVDTSVCSESVLTATPVVVDKVEELSLSEDLTHRLKAAFLHACRHNLDQAQSIVDEIFPTSAALLEEPAATIDTTVATLSREIIDDYPASDPRWAESVPHDAASSTSSLILLHQLEDKLKAHDYFLSFLKNTRLWDRLSSMISRDQQVCTHQMLCEHAEKLMAAISLRGHHTAYPNVVDAAIRKVLHQRGNLKVPSGLTPQDVFYREVSRIHEIMEALLDYEEEKLNGQMALHDQITFVSNVNTVIEGMLHEAWQYRQSKALVYQSTNYSASHREFLPWTASTGPRGMRALLARQHGMVLNFGVNGTDDVQQKGTLFQQLLDLTDILLDGYVVQLDSIQDKTGDDDDNDYYSEIFHTFEQQRYTLIIPFVDHSQLDRAASLAEKYCDFNILVKLCEDTNNQERLQRYMNQFADKGFTDFVFKWYLDEGKRGKLLSQPLPANQQSALSEFLDSHDHLSWLHDIQMNAFEKAHDTLKRLAYKETGSFSKKKTLLSLSKLSALASDEVTPAGVQAF
ncbi:nuclear pore complex protein Nup133-like isoform X2 [Glandiceps talaboti]